jgi:hypothetical protein
MIGSRPHILLSMREKWRHKISEPLQTSVAGNEGGLPHLSAMI